MAKKATVKSTKVIRSRNNNTWTEAEFWGKIRASLRKISMYWKPIQECKKGCRESYVGDNKRLKYVYRCVNCKEVFTDKEIHIDHKIPAGSLRSSDDLKDFVDKLFVEDSNQFQCLCKNCNIRKATQEKLDRKLNK